MYIYTWLNVTLCIPQPTPVPRSTMIRVPATFYHVRLLPGTRYRFGLMLQQYITWHGTNRESLKDASRTTESRRKTFFTAINSAFQ